MTSDVKKYPGVLFFSDDLTSSFTVNDLACFASHYKKVILVTGNICEINLPGNVERLFIADANYSTLKALKLNFASVIKIAVREFFSSSKYFLYPRTFLGEFSSLLRAHYKADILRQFVVSREWSDFIMYSFWFNHWATVLAVLNSREPLYFAAARAHGIDLFEDRIPRTKRIPFRWFQMKYINRVFSVSAAGSGYLKKKYPTHANKVFTSRLGTRDCGINPFVERGVFTLVSCAKIRNIKRIHLIAEILLHIDFPIKWIHIGGESENDPTLPQLKRNLEQLIQKKDNVEIVFLGDLSEERVFKTYLSESVNLFISVSETEGLPVSMMEAISFGIPVMATDVGGCNEIVNVQTGILIDKNFDVKNVAEEITRFKNSDKNDGAFRSGVRGFWENNFNAARNFDHFVSLMTTA